jgi:ubiquinone/menaquinone biosynthesis C-methylase UbiE
MRAVAAHPAWNPWENDRATLNLYLRRCRLEAEEMTCAAQAARILKSRVGPGESLLDAGCGGGYYAHSFQRVALPIEYHGLDYTPTMIQMARAEISPRLGIPDERFVVGAIEWLEGSWDNVVCFNVLTNSPHYAQPLERFLRCTGKRLLLRESMGDELIVRYTPDPYLDEGKRHIRVYHNQYPLLEVSHFMEELGFRVTRIVDERTGDGEELVVDIVHRWRILLAERTGAPMPDAGARR